MKKQGSVCDYTAARNAELVKNFNAAIRAAKILDLDKICGEVANSPASRFFISEERAYELIIARRRRGHWTISIPLRVEMIEEIERRAESRLRSGKAATLRDAVHEAVNSPAPRFYLTPRSCRTIVYATIHESHMRRLRERIENAKTPLLSDHSTTQTTPNR